jgi:cytochrome b561
MKKAILTALIISLMLIGCAIVEGSGSKLNFFAWFAYESMIIEFIDFLEA